ncbi:MAG TPA: T9SS type A sorting domain-containing protein [Puia sp.]|nr:T9SS type A sorting domain-containing protein [Puia sp.]
MSSYTVSYITPVAFKGEGPFEGTNHAEVPPWIIAGAWRSYFFVDGIGTYIWANPASMTTNDEIDLSVGGRPYTASMSYINSSDYDAGRPVKNWKRNYHGIYSAAFFNHPVEGPISLGFLHGENKNAVSGHNWYQNTIQKNVPIDLADPDSYSGGNPYHNGWKSYNGLISAAWVPNIRGTNWGEQFFKNELGPIAWPATGYITPGGVKCTAGLKHPSSLIMDDYVYVFYADSGPYGNNIPDEEGRHEGIKVVRAPLKDALDPHRYETYYRDTAGNDTWNASLPKGFTKENMLDFVAVRGPKATDITDDVEGSSQEIRFSVAKVRDSGYFIGVEQYIDMGDAKKSKVALRFSRDLVHWTPRVFTVYTADTWSQSRMNYPIFLSKDGWSNTEVDLDDFYILGTGNNITNIVNRVHIQAGAPASFVRMFTTLAAWPVSVNGLSPNPGTGLFKLTYTVNNPSDLSIAIFDMSGRQLKVQSKGARDPGSYTEDLDITTWAAGMYLIKIMTGNTTSLYKLVKI